MNSNPQKMPKVAKVKNKAPAEIQITAEQLLREAKERDLEIQPPPPKQKISDPAELADYQHRRRKQFEDNIRKNRTVMTNWIKYAQWEESQKEIQRARSIYERGLDIDHRNIIIWLKYTEMEMRCKQVNHARNLWDRAVTILPRVNQFWYKYTYMEEMLENIPGTRAVFERWMEWQPDEQAWQTYINFELRFKEIDRAREIYERFVITHPIVRHWIKFARFEENHGFIHSARAIYERAVHFYGDDYMEEKLYIAFARFEENQKEHDRARVIYKYALDHIPKEQTKELYKAYTIHEKKYGDRSGIEDVIVSKRKFQYEQEIVQNPTNYDAWFDLLRLVEGEGDSDSIRETYERAIANIPPVKNKQFWRRYIYLWINYALYEELEARDFDRSRLVYKECLQLLPHKVFTFSKIWLLLAQFEIRRKNLTAARKTLGYAIGTCPRDKLFRGYIEMEIQLREFDRCRLLYQKFLEFGPENCITWMKFAELETLLGDYTRARCIYELAIGQTRLDMPELLWKAYIDFEIGQDEPDNARNLYERLLERTTHVKVWLSYAKFELNADGSAESTENAVTKENEGKTSGDISNTGEITIQNNIPEDSSENTTEDENSSSAVDKRQITTETSNETTNKSTSTEVATSDETISTEVATSNENVSTEVATSNENISTEVATSNESTSTEVASSNETISNKIATSNETISTEVATSKDTTFTKVTTSSETTSTELSSSTNNPDNDMNIRLSRRVYERANDHLKTAGVDKESRVLLLEQWREFEERWGDESTRAKVAGKMPRRIKKRQSVVDESGVDQGWEEVFDYIFPEDEAGRPNLKLLAAAKNWKKKSDVVEEVGSSLGPAE